MSGNCSSVLSRAKPATHMLVHIQTQMYTHMLRETYTDTGTNNAHVHTNAQLTNKTSDAQVHTDTGGQT